jgi:hypothetical protein
MPWGEWQSGPCDAKQLRSNRGQPFNKAWTARQAAWGDERRSRAGGKRVVCDSGGEECGRWEHEFFRVLLMHRANGPRELERIEKRQRACIRMGRLRRQPELAPAGEGNMLTPIIQSLKSDKR